MAPRGRPPKKGAAAPTPAAAAKEKGPAGIGDDEVLGSPPPPAEVPPAPGSRAARRRNMQLSDDAPLSSLAAGRVGIEGRRLRRDPNPPLLKDAIVGFQVNEPDPVQASEVKDRQSAEIELLVKGEDEVPISKQLRRAFVWVAQTESVVSGKRYTLDPEAMQQCAYYQDKEQNRCDICGACCTEVLYEFRCYRRSITIAANHRRKLHAFVAYISQKCGAGLLGVQSEASKLREVIYRMTMGEDADKQLEGIFARVNREQQRVLQTELTYLAGGAGQEIELARSSTAFDLQVRKRPQDVFRCLASSLAPVLFARDLAAATVLVAQDAGIELKGWLSEVAQALQQGAPLPAPPRLLSRDELWYQLQLVVRALPLKVELYCLLQPRADFQGEHFSMLPSSRSKKDKERQGDLPLPVLKLVHLGGSLSLHSLNPPHCRIERSHAQAVADVQDDLLKRCRAAFPALQAPKMASGPTRTQDNEVVMPSLEDVTASYVEGCLRNITWPDCTSRANVRPDGVVSIKAMCLGMVKPYFMAVTASRLTKQLPRVTRLVNLLARRQLPPDFRYTSIQLNLNYSAKMHTDKNNHGPSYIIGMGDYTGGSLWVMDEAGDTPMQVTDKLTNFQHLVPGTTIMGRLVDIKGKWVSFNGKVPHMAMPFEGTRISVVYFSRKGSLDVGPEPKQLLEEMGFPLPDQEWLDKTADDPRASTSSVPMKRSRLGGEVPAPEEEEEAPDSDEEADEVDEDFRMHQEADRHEGVLGGLGATCFAQCFVEALKARAWSEASPRLGICTFQAGPGPVAAIALQELLPLSQLKVLCMTDASDASIQIARSSTLKPMCAYRDTDSFVAGNGFCEIAHRGDVRMPPVDECPEHLFYGTFRAVPFLNRDTSKKNYSTDPDAASLRAVRAHLAQRRPRLAVVEATDWDSPSMQKLHPRQQKGVLEFLLDGAEPYGLRSLGGYNVELVEVRTQDFGLPLDSTRLCILLAKQGCAGDADLQVAARLVHWLGSKLPKATVQEVLLQDGDPMLEEVRKKYWKRATAAARGVASREPGEYTAALRQEAGHEEMWFMNEAKGLQRQMLNQAYTDAKQHGLSTEGLVTDLSQAAKNQPWRDDGLLPNASSTIHYSFMRHRPLTGREELLCRGYPGRLPLKGIADIDLRRLAAKAPALQVVASCFAALLAVADLRLQQGRVQSLALASEALKELLGTVPQLPQGSRSVDNLDASVANAVPAEEGSSEEHIVSSRAVALLNLLSHKGFAAEEENGAAKAVGKEGKKVMEILQKVATTVPEPEPDFDEAEEARDTGAPAGSAAAAALAEVRDWERRKRKLDLWKLQVPPTTTESAMRWVTEAASDYYGMHAQAIVKFGTDYLLKCFRPETVPTQDHPWLCTSLDRVSSLLDGLVDALRAVSGFEGTADEIDSAAMEALFLRGIKQGDKAYAIDGGNRMADYVPNVMRRLKSWRARGAFLEHFEKVSTRKDWQTLRQTLLSALHAEGGIEAMLEMLEDMPKEWPLGVAVLTMIAKWPGFSTRVLPFLEQLKQEDQKKVRDQVEISVMQKVKESLNKGSKLDKLLDELREAPEPYGPRFAATARLLEEVTKIKEEADIAVAEGVPELATKWQARQKRVSQVQSETSEAHEALRKQGCCDGPAKENWKRLLGFEREQVTGLEHLLGARTAEAIRLEDQRRREEHAKDLQVAALKREADKAETIKALQTAASELRDLLHPSAAGLRVLRKPASDGHEELRQKATTFVGAQRSCQNLDARPDADVLEALEEAKSASRHYCRQQARLAMAKRKLRELNLGHCVAILERGELLERLDEFKRDGAALLHDLGLPRNSQQKLLGVAAEGKLDSKWLQPVVPRGWSSVPSKSCGLEYLQSGTGATRWEWPADEGPSLAAHRPEEPEAPPFLQGEAEDGSAPYLISWRRGGTTEERQAYCAVCGGQPANREHLRSPRHQDAVRRWQALSRALKHFQEEAKSAAQGGAEVQPGFQDVWLAELLHSLRSFHNVGQVFPVFWHLVVRQCWHADAASIDDVATCLDRMVEMAQAPEPTLQLTEVPKPGGDFCCYPPPTKATERMRETKELDPSEVLKLTAEDLLGEGLELQENGHFFCGYCETSVTEESLDKHLLSWHKVAQLHYRNRRICTDALNALKKEGWRLEDQAVRLHEKKYKCPCADKVGEWYQFFDEHAPTGKHKAHLAQLPRRTQEEDDAAAATWSAALGEAINRHLKSLQQQQSSRAPALEGHRAARADAQAPRAPASRPSTAPSQARQTQAQQYGGSSAEGGGAVSSRTAPAPDARPKPSLPVPDKDFPVLAPDDEGFRRVQGQLFCVHCEQPVTDEQAHKDTKKHRDWRQVALDAYRQLREQGHDLWKEGITLRDKEFHCAPCGRSGPWWQLFNEPHHVKTKNHQKAHYGAMGQVVPQRWEAQHRQEWRSLFASGSQQESQSSTAAQSPASPPRLVQQLLRQHSGSWKQDADGSEQSAKRQRTTEASPPWRGNASSTAAGSSSAAPRTGTGEVVVPLSARGWGDKPSASDKALASQKAANLHLPPLQNGVEWGWFDKYRKNLYIFCPVCKEYVGSVYFNSQTNVKKMDEEGRCDHFNADDRTAYDSAMERVLKETGW